MSQTRSRSKGAAAASAGGSQLPGGQLSPPEPELLMPAAGSDARGRAHTKKTRLVEQTTQEQELPGGDQVQIREVREVQEVVKRVAVVRPHGRSGAAARQRQADSEVEGEEAPEQAGSAGEGVATRMRRRVDAELAAAMQQDLGTAAAGIELRPGARRRVQRRVVVEGTEEPREPGTAGAASELPPTEPAEPELPGGALQAALGELEEAQRAEEAAAAATAGAAERRLQLPEEAEQEGEEGEEEEEEEGGEGQPGGGSEEFATPPSGRVTVEATPEELPPPTGAALRLRSTQAEGGRAGKGEERSPRPVHTPLTRKRKAPGAPPGSLPPLGLGARARRGGLFGDATAPAAVEEEGAEQQREQLPEEGAEDGGRAAAAAARRQQRRPGGGPLTAEEEAEWEEAGGEGAEESEEEEEAGGEAAAEEPEEAGGEAGATEAEEAQPATRGILGAVAAVGRTLRSALGAGTAAEQERPKAPALPAAAASRRRRTAKSAPAAPAASRAKAGGATKKRGAKKGRGRGAKEESYRRYLYRVLKQVHPEMGISAKAMTIMNDCMADVFNRVAEEAGRLTQHGKRVTLTSREVQTAVRLTLPGALGAHAIQEGKQAVLRSVG